jgi:predicted esterase
MNPIPSRFSVILHLNNLSKLFNQQGHRWIIPCSARLSVYLLLGTLLFIGSISRAEESPSNSPDPVTSTRALETLQQLLTDSKSSPSKSSPEQMQPIASIPLTKQDAQQAIRLIQDKTLASARDSRKQEFEERLLKDGNLEMPFQYRTLGKAPDNGRSLYISMHGGGGTTKQVNDGQWRNQIGLYTPEEGIYVAPRAPTNTWNLWHQDHIDKFFVRLIEDFVLFENVNPNRVFLMGYSAGGDGVYQLAPRMSDRFAAASMMAGHPNETDAIGLRNLPFAIFMGGKDSAYQRNKIAEQWQKRLAELRDSDPDGYTHMVKIYPDFGHWMNRQDAEALPWMAKHERNAWPKKIVWKQDDVTHQRFYWLELSPDRVQSGDTITAQIDGQKIQILSSDVDQITLNLSDNLIDLDQPVKICWNDEVCFEGSIKRTIAAIQSNFAAELFPPSPGTARITVKRESRAASNDEQLKSWLQNMLIHHRYTDTEASEVLGISATAVLENAKRLGIDPTQTAAPQKANEPLLMLPYPGGRHPRIGFLDGALKPQRETKISVFAPWDSSSYTVIDVPEAIWSNLGLTYLAHTHVDTIWSLKKIDLPQLEWERVSDHELKISRTLPNGIKFDVQAVSHVDHIQLEMKLFNGTDAPLSDLRVQMCAMLKGMKGFEQQTNENKIFRNTFAACKNRDGNRWVIWAWQPIHKSWGNAPCPCLHADPKFPDCPPGATQTLSGWLSFFEGTDIESELKRIESQWK